MAGNLGRAGSREERTLQALLLEKSRRKRISAILCPPYCGFMFEVPLVTSVVHDPDSIPLFAKIGVQALADPQRIIAGRWSGPLQADLCDPSSRYRVANTARLCEISLPHNFPMILRPPTAP